MYGLTLSLVYKKINPALLYVFTMDSTEYFRDLVNIIPVTEYPELHMSNQTRKDYSLVAIRNVTYNIEWHIVEKERYSWYEYYIHHLTGSPQWKVNDLFHIPE